MIARERRRDAAIGPQFPDASPQFLGESGCDRERFGKADARNCFKSYNSASIAGFESRDHGRSREHTRKSAAGHKIGLNQEACFFRIAAHRLRCATAIFLRVSALKGRRFRAGPDELAWLRNAGGRPRRLP